jgi:hypothetical protein
MTQAILLKRHEQYGLAMYVAGLAAECMLRAYHAPDRAFDERHDVAQLFRRCDSERLGSRARARLRGPIQTVHLLWQNRYRYFSEDRLRSHLRSMRQHERGIRGKADFVKVRCSELVDACVRIVTVGEERWTSN